MTFDEYIKNPSQSYVMPNKVMYNDMYQGKWDLIKVRENGNIRFTLYKGKDDYFVHFKIPDEVVPKFYYDTIIRFYLPFGKKKYEMERNLKNYDIQVYSNDPSFVYTFCYAFKSHDMFIKDLENKMSRLALKVPAKQRNPKNEIGYVKSIYFSYLEFKRLGLFDKIKWETLPAKYNKNVWNSTVEHADDKLRERQEESAKISKEKKAKRLEELEKAGKAGPKKTNMDIPKIESPNIKDFGHFKNKIASKISKLNKGDFGKFKKN